MNIDNKEIRENMKQEIINSLTFFDYSREQLSRINEIINE
jgi:hypothetical protein